MTASGLLVADGETIIEKNGIIGLNDTRKGNSGRPLERNLSDKEKLEKLKLENTLLKAENELLKKADLLERRMIKRK